MLTMKTIDDHFADWEGQAFGYGYGSGEEHVIHALRMFFERLEEHRSYDYRTMEVALTPMTTWLLINALVRADIIEYGTSPRFGWLTQEGDALRRYVSERTAEQLVETLTRDSGEYIPCSPIHCNCDEGDCRPNNPFWPKRAQ
jgi:hypothetical protein